MHPCLSCRAIWRSLGALLNRKKVERLADGCFLYASRPYQLLKFQLQAEVVLRYSWDGDQLTIVSEHCKIHGLGPSPLEALAADAAQMLQGAEGAFTCRWS